ncbi:MAG: SusC/RagA family TonB-linked outer membrane protein [Bacteroidales bacterium]|nr:SusC/RagA family TonB-linked outer membrane protein [Bacteroidales bacterium]
MKNNIKARLSATLACAAFFCSTIVAQDTVTGRVVDQKGTPIAGVSVVVDGTTTGTITDSNGNYSLKVDGESPIVSYSYVGYKQERINVQTASSFDVVLKIEETEKTYVGNSYCKDITLEENVGAVSVISENDFKSRTSKNIGDALIGQGLGLTALQGRGHYADTKTTFYVRGLKTLSDFSNDPLILVDGIEREIEDVTPYEVESVTVLKDATAVAIYGYKGANGVINIKTKRGEYDALHVDFSYEHSFERQSRKPEFVDAATFARAYNEAVINDGASTAYYNDAAISAYEKGTHPDLFPNVDWQKETLRDWAHAANYNLTFHGGSQKFKYYTMLNVNSDRGFNAHGEDNADYRTQDQYSRGSLRSNVDIDITETTRMTLNVLGTIAEARKTGSNFKWSSKVDSYEFTSVWDALYSVPANAFPVKVSNYWGGHTDGTGLDGTYNPVAISSDAGYIKNHNRGIFVDLNIDQNLSIFAEGLGGFFRLAYDNKSYYVENYTRKYDYAFYKVNGGAAVTTDGVLDPEKINALTLTKSADADGNSIATSLSTDANNITYSRAANIQGGFYYDKKLSDTQKLYAQLRYDFEKRDTRGVNTTNYYQNFSLVALYTLLDKYTINANLVASEHNFFAPGHKWGVSPSFGLGWTLSKEDFLANSDAINFLKLRASWGRLHVGNVPAMGYWEQTYGGGPAAVMLDSKFTTAVSTGMIDRAVTNDDNNHELSDKFNVGLDAKLFDSLDLTLDYFRESRHGIWVDASNKYSNLLGFTAPYETEGKVFSTGFEAGLNFIKPIGDLTLNIGGKFAYNHNEIKEQYEETKYSSNLETTGHPVGQLFGMKSIGFVTDADVAAGYTQNCGTTVRAGDLKYADVNGDGLVDTNDLTAIGDNATCPEIYYSFNLGAEWNGLGFNVLFQGAAKYSIYLKTKSVYVPLVDNTNISKEYYDNRWTPSTPNAKYPRLSAVSNANNFRENSTWIQDRSFLKLRNVELYYNLPQSLLEATKVIKGSRIFVRGIDLACFDKLEVVDPEAPGEGYPLTKSVVAGITLNF